MPKFLRLWIKDFNEMKRFCGTWYAIKLQLKNIWGVGYLWDIYYFVRYRTWAKFHVVKTDLNPGYHDIDQRLIHANFCLLAEFVEKEKPFETVVWDDDEVSIQAAKEIKELYNWWKNIYPNYDKNDPLFVSDIHYPGHDSVPDGFDEDGDPTVFRWVQKGTDEENEKWTKTCKESLEYEVKCQKEIEENIIRLAKIRVYLWT